MSYFNIVTAFSEVNMADHTFTRPNDSTPYSAGDVVSDGAIIEFDGSSTNAGANICITRVDIRIDVATAPATTFRLHLYNAAPTATTLTDNVAFDLPANDRAKYLGYIDIDAPTSFGTTSFVQVESVNKYIKLGNASTSVFAILQTLSGFTPTAQAVKTLRLYAVEV